MIKYLTHQEINKTKWDECIDESLNSFVYGYSWYLDEAAPNWDALVLNDYEAVFPLTHKKKFSFQYLYQPLLTQQLGVFYKNLLGKELLLEFIQAIPQKFRLIDICLNEANETEAIPLIKRKNFVLDLEKPHPKHIKNYSDHTRRNANKAKKNNLHITDINYNEVINLHLKNKNDASAKISATDYDRVRKIMAALDERKILKPIAVVNEKNEIQSAGLFILHKNRLIYIMGTTTPQGKESRSMYFMFDDIIKQYSEQPVLLDFEGSDVPGIARFFKGFGSKKQPYFKLHINKLPWYIKLFKK